MKFEDYELEERRHLCSECYPESFENEWKQIDIHDIQNELLVQDIKMFCLEANTKPTKSDVWQSYLNFLDEMNCIMAGIEDGSYWIDEQEGF